MNDAFTDLAQTPKASFRELDAIYEYIAPANISKMEVPGDFWFVLSLRTPERKLDQVHWQVLDRTYRTIGIPSRFARYQNHIELDPIPREPYQITMRYRRRLPKLMPNMMIPIEREWHEMLIELSVAKGLGALQRWEESAGRQQIIDGTISNKQDNPLLEDDGFETTIGVRLRW